MFWSRQAIDIMRHSPVSSTLKGELNESESARIRIVKAVTYRNGVGHRSYRYKDPKAGRIYHACMCLYQTLGRSCEEI